MQLAEILYHALRWARVPATRLYFSCAPLVVLLTLRILLVPLTLLCLSIVLHRSLIVRSLRALIMRIMGTSSCRMARPTHCTLVAPSTIAVIT